MRAGLADIKKTKYFLSHRLLGFQTFCDIMLKYDAPDKAASPEVLRDGE